MIGAGPDIAQRSGANTAHASMLAGTRASCARCLKAIAGRGRRRRKNASTIAPAVGV